MSKSNKWNLKQNSKMKLSQHESMSGKRNLHLGTFPNKIVQLAKGTNKVQRKF